MIRLLAAITLLGAASLLAAPPSILFEPPLFRVAGVGTMGSRDWPSVFAIYAGEGDLPPVLGSYHVADGDVIFEPRFPLRPGVKYRAVFRAVQPEISATFEIPAVRA